MAADIQLAREKAYAEAELKREIAAMQGQTDMVNAMNQPEPDADDN